MTVKEYREALALLPDDLKVVAWDTDYCVYDDVTTPPRVVTVRPGTVHRDNSYRDLYGDPQEGDIQVVSL